MKLIHSGKVLKDDQTIESCGIKPNDFLVVMVTKPKKPVAAPAPPPVASTTEEKEEEADKTSAPAPSVADKSSDAPTAPASSAAATTTTVSSDLEFPAEIVNNLTGMGFPEAEVRHCLRAANGNPDIAVEFLTNGIPPGMQPGEQGGAASAAMAASSTVSGGGQTLSTLRNHPQFNDLRRLVQSDPHMLQTVLTQIGQQQPDLLAEINANQEEFLRMMNEPISESSSSSGAGAGGTSSRAISSRSSSGGGSDGAEGGLPPGLMEGMANPAQMAQLIQSMSAEELNQMAGMMGLSADQLRATAQMLGQIPPEQLQQYMMQAMGGGDVGSLGGMMGGGGGGGPQVLRLTEEEMAAVDRLADMGFDRTEAAQAYLACDKNEALAANLLMDSMADGGFGFGGGGGDGEGHHDDDNDDDDDDDHDGDDAMYD
jgi:UV excision repair protein RAD23